MLERGHDLLEELARQPVPRRERRQRDRAFALVADEVDQGTQAVFGAAGEAHERILDRIPTPMGGTSTTACEHPCEMASRVVDFRGMADDISHILSADVEDDADRVIEGTLRPRTLDEYIGQREVKANLSVLLQAARGRGEAADHVLLYGPPGLGKTTLATIIARELGVNVKYASGPGDRARRRPRRDPHLARGTRRPVHRRDPPAQPGGGGDPLSGDGGLRARRDDRQGPVGAIAAPEPQAVHRRWRHDPGGPDQLPAARPVRGDLPARLLRRGPSSPRSSSARRRSWASGSNRPRPVAIARRGRGTPRIVNRLLKRVRDHAQVHGDGQVDEATATAAMRAMEIDDEGLDSTDRKLLAAIVQKFASGPVGVAALAAVLSEETETIEDVYEPFLLRLGFIDRTPSGRIATDLARAHLSGLGYEIPPPRRVGSGHARPVGRPGRRDRGRTNPPSPLVPGDARPTRGPSDAGRRPVHDRRSRRRPTARRGHGPGS